MAVESSNGGLNWKARIDTSSLESDAKRIQQTFEKLGKKNASSQKQILSTLSTEFQKIGRIANESFLSLTPTIQKQSLFIQKLTTDLGKVNAAQKNLNSTYESGKIKTSDYNTQAAALAATERDLKNQISLESTALKQNLVLMDQSKGSIKAMQIELNALKSSFSLLSESERENSNVGGKLIQNIAEIENKITLANNRVKELATSYNRSIGSINEYKDGISRLSKAYDEMSGAERRGSKGTANLAQQTQYQKQIQIAEQLKKTTLENLTVFKQTSQSLENLGQRVSILTQRYNQLTVAQAKDPNVGGKIQAEIQAYEKQIDSVSKYNQALKQNMAIQNMANGSLEQKRAKLALLQVQYSRLTEAELKNKAVGGQLANQIRTLDRDISKYGKSLSNTGKQSRLFNQIMIATAGIFSITQGTRLIGDIVRTRGEIEQLEVAFTTMLGSKEKADDLMKEIVQVATTTPFKLTEVADATKQLLAYGFAQNEIKQELLAIGNIASGVGASFQEVAYAYGTLRSQGRAYMRDIRQFTTRGIPIMEELAKVLNTTTDNVQNLVEAGKVGFPEVQKAFQNLTGAGGQFFNLMEKQSQTVTGEIAKLQDRIQLMFNDIGKGNEGVIKDSIAGLSFLVENYKDVIDIIAALVITYGSYRAALIVTAASQAALGTSTFALGRIMVSFRSIMQGLNATLIASPIGAYTALITALGLAFYALTKSINTAKAVQENYNDAVNTGAIAAGKELATINDLVAILKSENATRGQKESAIKSLQGILGDHINGYTQEEIASGKAQDAIEKYTKAIEDNVASKKAFEQYSALRDQLVELETKGVEALSRWQRAGEDLRNVFDPRRGKNFTFGEYFKYLISGDKQDQVILESFKKDIREQMNSLSEAFDITGELTGSSSKSNTQYTVEDAFKKLLDNTSQYFDTLVALVGNKGDADKIKEGLEQFLESLAPNDPQIGKVKAQLIKINKVLETYSLKNENKEIKDSASERKKILDQLNNLEDKAYKKSFDKREQEKADLKRQIQEIRELAKEAGFGSGVLNRIDNLELNATGNIDYRSDTETLKEEFDKRKKLYEDYENHVRDFGVDSAEKRFRSELDIAKNYLGDIQEEYTKLLGFSAGRTVAGGSLTGPESERLRDFKIILDAEAREQEAQYLSLLRTSQDYEQKRNVLVSNYQKDRAKLVKNGDTAYLAEFDKQFKLSLEELNLLAAKDLTGFTKFFDTIEFKSRKAALDGIKILRQELLRLSKLDPKDGGISAEDFAKINAELDVTVRNIKEEIPRALGAMSSELGSISGLISDSNSGFAQMLGLLSNVLGSLAKVKSSMADFNQAKQAGDGLGQAVSGLGIIGAVAGIFIGIAKIFEAGFAKQNALQVEQLRLQRQIYTGELEINSLYRERALLAAEVEGSTLKSLNNQQTILAENLEKIKADIGGINDIFGEQLSQNQLAYLNSYEQQAEKRFEKTLEELGKYVYDTGRTEIQKGGFLGLSNKTVKIFESLAGLSFEQIEELSLKGQLTEQAEELFQQLVKLKEEGKDVADQLKDIENQLTDIFTGGLTASGLADNIISEFQGAGSEIENILRSAILNGFKYRFLEEPLNALIDQFSKDAQSGGELTTSEIDAFTNAYNKLSEDAKKALDQLQASTGINLSNPNGAGGNEWGISKAIKAITTEQASELTGLFRGFYDLQKIRNNVSYEHLAVANSQLASTMAIQTNTANTVAELQNAVVELKTIAKNTKPGQSDRGLGIGG